MNVIHPDHQPDERWLGLYSYEGNGILTMHPTALLEAAGIAVLRPSFKARLRARCHECLIPSPETLRRQTDG